MRSHWPCARATRSTSAPRRSHLRAARPVVRVIRTAHRIASATRTRWDCIAQARSDQRLTQLPTYGNVEVAAPPPLHSEVRSRERALLALLVLSSVAALLLSLQSIRRAMLSRGSSAPSSIVSQWRAYAAFGVRRGPADAALTIVVFSDYQCTLCAEFEGEVGQLLTRHPDLAVVWRHYPLRGHILAFPAAKASVCAARQGQFEGMHKELFTRLATTSTSPDWLAWAARARIPSLGDFDTCLRSEIPARAVAVDAVAAESLDIVGTPLILLDSALYRGRPHDFRAVVTRRLTGERSRPGTRAPPAPARTRG